MAKGYHRLSFRARHLLRQLGKAKNITLQRLNLHELRHAISRKHGFRGPKKAPSPGTPGLYQRMSGKARHLMHRLRHSRTWQVQKQSVTELEREVERGARIAQAREARRERREDRIERAYERAKRVAERGRKVGAAASRGARTAGRKFRATVNRGQERLLTRAERRQRERQKRGPGRIRQSVRSVRDNARRRLRPRGRQQQRRTPSPLRPRPARVQNRPLRPSRAPRPPRAPRAPQPQRPARTR